MPTAPATPNQHPPRYVSSFANIGGGADIDLEAVSGRPRFGPQEVLLHATAAASVDLFLIDGSTLTVVVAANETRSIVGPIIGVDASGTTTAVVTMVAYWRTLGDPQLN